MYCNIKGSIEWDEGGQKVQSYCYKKGSTGDGIYSMMTIVKTVVCSIWKKLVKEYIIKVLITGKVTFSVSIWDDICWYICWDDDDIWWYMW